MSSENSLVSITQLAAADLSSSQYFITKTDTAGKAALSVAGVTDWPTGVVQNNPTSGNAATIAVSGITKVKAGGVVAPGAKVASDANGNAVTATTGDYVLGIAQNTANTATNDIFSVLIQKFKI